MRTIILIICTLSALWAQSSEASNKSAPQVKKSDVPLTAVSQDTTVSVADTIVTVPKDTMINILDEFEIFGTNDQLSVFILGFDNLEIDQAVKEQIMMRQFSRDLFFMQNIDQEEFEEQRSLRTVPIENGSEDK